MSSETSHITGVEDVKVLGTINPHYSAFIFLINENSISTMIRMGYLTTSLSVSLKELR